MKPAFSTALAGAALGTCVFVAPTFAQQTATTVFGGKQMVVESTLPNGAQVLLPRSSILRPEDRGLRARTHYKILKLPGFNGPVEDLKAISPALTEMETPASLACVYKLVVPTSGCNPSLVSKVVSGGTRAIGIVDAFHNPTALKDLKKFSATYGLPVPNLQIVYCSSTTCAGVSTPPAQNQDWAGEIALDIQWAHAMAPHAKIILVEAFTNSFADLLRAEDRAAQLVAAAGGGQVSNSWGGLEFGGQASFDSHFLKSKVVFFASTGDHKCAGAPNCVDVEWPSTSPNVVGVGGTTIVRTNTHLYSHQQAWIDTGGGLSSHYARPSFQDVIASKVGAHRGVPDVAWNADPFSGVPVYCSAGSCGASGGFFQFGGTSLASPAIAAITNNAGHFRASTAAEHTALYNEYGTAKFVDVAKGKCGNGTGGAFVLAGSGWDRCTGIGTPNGKTGL